MELWGLAVLPTVKGQSGLGSLCLTGDQCALGLRDRLAAPGLEAVALIPIACWQVTS